MDIISNESILEALKNSQEKVNEIEKEQRKLFAQQLALYCFKNPEAIFFIVGQTGEYDDEGYSGCFVARIDPEFMYKQLKEIPEKERGGYRAPPTIDELKKRWTIEKAKSVVRARGSDDEYINMPFEVDYGALAQQIQVPELNAFDGVQALNDVWEEIGGKYGKAWAANEVEQIVRIAGQNHAAILSEIEAQTLSGEPVKKPRRRAKKTL
jgi:hypothetical protein